jgi:hypothetical protein
MIAIDFLPETKPRKVPKASYRKPDSIKQFEKQYQAWYYKGREHNFPPEYQIKLSFRDDRANDLTKLICAWLKMNGYFAARVNTTGTYNAKLGKFIRSGSTNGMADITSVINGKHVSIEVKVCRDRPRPDQIKVQEQIRSAGGVYIFVHSFDDFLEQIKNLI